MANPTAKDRDTYGMPDGSYPVRTHEQAMNALALRGKSKSYSAQQVIAHVRRRAQKMGWSDIVTACDKAVS